MRRDTHEGKGEGWRREERRIVVREGEGRGESEEGAHGKARKEEGRR